MTDKHYCNDCKHYDYDEMYDRETGEEIRMWSCEKDKSKNIDPYSIACEDYEEDKLLITI